MAHLLCLVAAHVVAFSLASDTHDGSLVLLQKHAHLVAGDLDDSPSTASDVTLNACLKECGWRTGSDLAGMSADDKRNTAIVELSKAGMGSVTELQGQDNNALAASCSEVALGFCLIGRGWRTEVTAMSADDKRNTVIVELNKGGMGSISELQGQDNNALVASCSEIALGSCLTGHSWRTEAELAEMSADDKRNTVIVELSKGMPISELQGLGNEKLAEMCSLVVDVKPACADWCYSKKNIIKDFKTIKCNWLSCAGCSECS